MQTPANVPIVAADAPPKAVLEVLHNWLDMPSAPALGGSHPAVVPFRDQKIFVYAGNMGVAQDLGAFVALARGLQHRRDIGFLLIGRGSEKSRLASEIASLRLGNIRVEDQVTQEELSGLLTHCHAGIIALHPAHGTHNIPGKLLTYLQAGLPVLARVNPGNDLHDLVRAEGVGLSVAGDSLEALVDAVVSLADDPAAGREMGRRGRELSDRLFSPAAAAAQVVRGLSGP